MNLKDYHSVLICIIILNSTLNSFSGMCYQLFTSSDNNSSHYDIVSFNQEIKVDWTFENQLLLMLPTSDKFVEGGKNFNFSTYLEILAEDKSLKHYGQMLVFNKATEISDVILILKQIEKFYSIKSIRSPYFFIKIQSNTKFELLAETYQNNFNNLSFNLPPTSDIFLIFNSYRDLEIMEIYSIKNHTFVQIIETDKTEVESLDFDTLIKRTSRRWNFQRIEIVAVSQDVKGYELSTDFEDNSPFPVFKGGFEVQSYWFLRDALNFSEVARNGTGFIREGPNGTLTGMAAQINKGEADLSISSNEYLEYRAAGPDGISYLHSTFFAEMDAYFKQPPASSIRDVFVSAFTFQLWVLLLVLWIFIGLTMYIAYKIYLKCFDQIDPKDLQMSQEIPIWAAGAICQQGWYFTPVAIGARIIFFFGWFTGFLCYIAFSAQLVSILAIEVIPVRSFSDLLAGNFFIVNDGHIPTTKYFVKGLQDQGKIPVLSETVRNVDIEPTITKLIYSTTAMISVSDSFYPILEDEGYSQGYICKTFSHVRVGSPPVKMSMFVKRGSPLREYFNCKILLMSERGIKNRLMRTYIIDTSVQCLKQSSGFNSALGSKDVFTVYAILIFGFGISVSMAFAEKLFHKLIMRQISSISTDSVIQESHYNLDLELFVRKRDFFNNAEWKS